MPHLVLSALLLAIAGFIPSTAAAEGERVFDPQLSLIGGCKEETLDPVEDPGCPKTPPPSAHPPTTFSNPKAVATDSYGNIYVSSYGSNENGSQGRIDIFCSDGVFVSRLVTPGPTSLAIDSKGFLYVYSNPSTGGKLLRFTPTPSYQPGACDIEYNTSPTQVDTSLSFYSGLAINRDNDHLFANFGSSGVVEYKSAEDDNEEVGTLPGPSWGGGAGLAVDADRDRLYTVAGFAEERIDIYDLSTIVEGQYQKIGSIQESAVPANSFGTQLSIAVNEGDNHVFVLDGENCQLYEFDENDAYLATIVFPIQCTIGGEIGVDNGPFSPNGGDPLNKNGRYLYVPSHTKGIGHSFAFFEENVGPPEIVSTAVANVSEDEAELKAQIKTANLDTTYSIEYISEQAAKANEAELKDPFAGGTAVNGALPADSVASQASAAATNLEPGTDYRFRVFAANEEGDDEAEGSFATYPSIGIEPISCSNALFRTGPSALLPDCRAYELVTPPDTNARAPLGVGNEGGVFTTRQVSPAGDKLPFRVEGGSLPGLGGIGSLVGDPYLTTRTDEGWSTAYTGPSGDEATAIAPGASSPDQGYLFWWAGGKGSAVLESTTAYVRYPDGHSELLGQGSLGRIDPQSVGQLISEGGDHIVFSTGALASPDTAVQLEPDAAPDKTMAIYDRTPDGITHVVSLKPGDEPFGSNEDAIYLGASFDGRGIAFKVNNVLYLRYDNDATFAIGTGVDFAGVAEGGDRVFYVEGDNLKAFDVDEGIIDFSITGDVTPATVASDGSSAYFISPSVLGGTNPQGDSAQPGQQNLYLSEEGLISFVGTVTERDVKGQPGKSVDGLGLWVSSIGLPPPQGRLGSVPARTTPDGGVFLFKSRAALTGYDPDDHAQIYRYDSTAGELECLSCNPTGAAATSDANLQSEDREGTELFAALAWPENLRADGRRAFFESSEPLVAGDGDGLQDVYEWEDQGVGSCTQPEGCLYLISSPQSTRDEYLWAVSRSGNDVFFLSSGLLVGTDVDETPSIYDARVGGGFAEEAQAVCEGEGCRPTLSPPPVLPSAGTPVRGAGDQVKPTRRCGKGKRQVKRAGKVRCVKKKKTRKQAKNRAGANQKGGSR